LFLIKLVYDGGSYVYFGFRHQSVLFSPSELFLGKFYQTLNTIFASDKPGLPVVKLYISEKAQRQLLQDPPRSTKKWKRGYIVLGDQELREAKIKHRGENIRNFGHLKKSWKAKVKRKNLYQRQRVFNFIIPRGDMLHDIMPYWLAEEISLLTPKVDFVELHLNDQNHGVTLLAQQLDENFLRNSGFMPVNLYKGEPDDGDGLVGPSNDDLFNSLKGWSKQAVNNAYPKADRTDIKNLLELLAKAPSQPSTLEELKSVAQDDDWVKFAVFQELSQSWHNARHANIRLLMDDWRGAAIPIPWDTTFKYRGGEPEFDRISHALMMIYMQRGDFLLKKYRLLHQALNTKAPLEKVAQRFERLEPALEASLGRDAHYQAWTSLKHKIVGRESHLRQERAAFVAKIRRLSSKLKERLNQIPDVSWMQESNGFSLMMDGEIPVAELTLSLDVATNATSPDARLIWLDLDRDGVFSQNDVSLPFSESDGKIILHGAWLTNRVVPPTKEYVFLGPQITALQKTRFPIRSNKPLTIMAVTGKQGLTGREVSVPKAPLHGALPAKWNRPVLPESPTETERWEGVVVIERDTIVEARVDIDAGTVIKIDNGANLVFRNSVRINGTTKDPVLIEPLKAGGTWGTFALQGQKTTGSVLRHVNMKGGSGGSVKGIRYTGMFSIHDTQSVTVDHLKMTQNAEYDDMFHIIYAKDIKLSHITLTDARSDALDIDMSSVGLTHLDIANAGNDAIDLMDSEASIRHAVITGAGDKGISVGEGSDATIVDSQISNSQVGIESKDGSKIAASRLRLNSNATQLSAYLKNWRYGQGGNMHIKDSQLGGTSNKFNIRRKSLVRISGSNLYPVPTFAKPTHGKRVQFDRDVTYLEEQPTPGAVSN